MQRACMLFEQALGRPAGQRARFLAQACGDDAELRAEVESLLQSDALAGEGFMRPPDSPAQALQGPSAAHADAAPLIGRRIGSYRIRRVIAAGGMGTVYLAEQEHPRRDVALKVMRLGMGSRSAMGRLEYEAEILARLRHPNIAQVYEAGVHHEAAAGLRAGGDDRLQGGPTEQSRDRERAGSAPAEGDRAGGIPYFAMEYIPDARPITDLAAEKGLTTRERLNLFSQVCDAVHHGHQKGIIHRDLKPANILVDRAGQAKIIDFGVARMTDSDITVTTMEAGVGALIGTLQYMSPEQCAADPHEIDVRSDVYSLGVVLYELLCGRLPYDVTRAAIPTAARVICEQSPPRPSTIDRRLRGDLECILLTALEKDRERRYQSAADLLRDIRHYLNREPIEARPPGLWTHVPRWLARHPVVTTSAAGLGIAAVLVAAGYVSAWSLFNRPYRLAPSADGREVRLLSFGNRVLHVWHETCGFAHLIARPRERGGSRLAVVGFGRSRTDHLRGSLCAFDVSGDREQPIWTRRIETDDIPLRLREQRGFVAEQFAVQDCWAFDVFPGLPGRELVAVYGHYSSKRAVRIYNFAGELLYQVWHDGSLPQCYWMAEAGLLVFAGDCQGPFWDGEQPKGARGRALALLAVRPKPEVVLDGYLRWEPGDDAADPANPAWYWGLGPSGLADAVQRAWLEAPRPPHRPGSAVQWTMQVGPRPEAAVWWVVDQAGREVPGSRDWDDTYKLNLKRFPAGDERRLPDPRLFRLVALSELQSAPQPPADSRGAGP